MGTDKRERQKASRQAKIEQLRVQERRQSTKRRGFVIGGFVVVFLLGAIVVSVLTRDDGDSEVSSDDTTTTSAVEDTTTTTLVEITGTPPTTVPVGEPVDPTCPAPDGSSPATYDFTGAFENCLTDGVDYQARFVTTKGDVLVDLREAEMPGTVNNFVALARYHYFDNGDLFRTDPSIDIIQGGSPHTQDNADPGPGYTIPDEGGAFEFDPNTGQGTGPFTYLPGQLIMARSAGPDSSGAQYFFSTGENVANLDSQGVYLLFGDVIEGLDILQEVIGLHVVDGATLGGRPSEYVIVERVEIIEA